MVPTFLALVSVLSSASVLAAPADCPPPPKAGDRVEVMSREEFRAIRNRKAWAYTVFEGTEIECSEVQLTRLWENALGSEPALLFRPMGRMAATGVVRGMSGSPVYLDGKLVGAISLSIGQFNQTPLGGITPAYYMLETIENHDRSKEIEQSQAFPLRPIAPLMKSAPANLEIRPIDSSVRISGVTVSSLPWIQKIFEGSGIEVQSLGGAGSSSSLEGSDPMRIDPLYSRQSLPPGSAVAEVISYGDVFMGGVGTVTYNDGRHVLAYGHPSIVGGPVRFGMAEAEIAAIVDSRAVGAKVANVGRMVGAMLEGRPSGILGELGESVPFIPVKTIVRTFRGEKTFRTWVVDDRRFLDKAIAATVVNLVSHLNEVDPQDLLKAKASLQIDGQSTLRAEDLFRGGGSQAFQDEESAAPSSLGAGVWLSQMVQALVARDYQPARVKEIQIELEPLPGRGAAKIEKANARAVVAVVGEEIPVEVGFKVPGSKGIVSKMISVPVPKGLSPGKYKIQVASSLAKNQKIFEEINRVPNERDLASEVSLWSSLVSNGKLYVSFTQEDSGASNKAARPGSIEKESNDSDSRGIFWRLFGGKSKKGNAATDPSQRSVQVPALKVPAQFLLPPKAGAFIRALHEVKLDQERDPQVIELGWALTGEASTPIEIRP